MCVVLVTLLVFLAWLLHLLLGPKPSRQSTSRSGPTVTVGMTEQEWLDMVLEDSEYGAHARRHNHLSPRKNLYYPNELVD